jgi:HSP20 family molecular chaperone IbpA
MIRKNVVVLILLGLVFWAGAILGQQGGKVQDRESDLVEKKLKMREEMHRRLLDKLLHGVGSDQDMFSDMEKMMEEMMKESFSGFSSSLTISGDAQFKMEWSESKAGRTLEITPKDPEQQLDINISNGLITIQGKAKSEVGGAVTLSNFSNSLSVPSDCDASKVKMDHKDGKLLVQFPFLKTKEVEVKPKNRRIPIGPNDGDVSI